MKTLLTIACLLFTLLTNAQPTPQPVEVLMVGTSHDYGKKPVEDFKAIVDKVAGFKPDAVFGEFLSAADYDAIPDYWNKTTMEKRFAYMKGINYPAPANPDKFIRQTTKLLQEYPNYHQDRMKLARAFYLNHDYANARYQLYRLDKARPVFGAEEVAAYNAILGPPDSIYTARTNEYHNIVFPLIDQLRLGRIEPMDSQRHDLNWQAAWDKVDALFKPWEAGLEKDSTSDAAQRYKALNQRITALTKASNKAGMQGKATAYFNSPDGDEFLNIVNFYGAHRLFGAAGFPQTEVEAMLAEWQKRNDDMVRNTVERARKAGAKRVVVFVGANHRKIMVDGFRKMPGVTVYELNSF
jgi:hypothetical protein